MKGKQKRVLVYRGGKLIETYETVMDANKKYFPEKMSCHLNNMFNRKNGIITIGELTLIKTNERGITKNYRKYLVLDKNTNKKFVVVGTNELLSIVNYGHNNFYKQFKVYGNYQDNQYSVWRIN